MTSARFEKILFDAYRDKFTRFDTEHEAREALEGRGYRRVRGQQWMSNGHMGYLTPLIAHSSKGMHPRPDGYLVTWTECNPGYPILVKGLPDEEA